MTPDQLIDYVARTESGGRYDAWAPDDNGHGVSFGLIQFNQKVGSLPELVRRMRIADPGAFRASFGSANRLGSDKAVRETDLADDIWKSHFIESASFGTFRQVQRDLAREGYLDPAWAACQAVGLTSERAVALAFDAAVQHGVGWMRRNLLKAEKTHPNKSYALPWFSAEADKGLADRRRYRILTDPTLSDDLWSLEPRAAASDTPQPRLRRGSSGPEVRGLQTALNRLMWWEDPLKVDGVFGKLTEELLGELCHFTDLDADEVAETSPEVWAALDAALLRIAP